MRQPHQATRRWLLGAGLASAAVLPGCVTFHDGDLLPRPDVPPAQGGIPAGARLLAVPGTARPVTAYYAPGTRPGVLVAFGGNGNDARTMLRVLQRHAAIYGLGFVVPSYYVTGQTPPSVVDLRQMAAALYAAASALPGQAGRVFVLGHSLGCWIALDLAAAVAPAGLLVAGVGTTVAATFAPQYAPLDRVLRYRSDADVGLLDARQAAHRVTAPTLVVASDADTAIPAGLSRQVYDALPGDTRREWLHLHAVPHGALLSAPPVWQAAARMFDWN